MIDLTGTCTVVTGGNGGVGLGLAHGIARGGGDVAVWARNPEKSQAAVAELSSHGIVARAFRCDIADRPSVERALEETIDGFGKVDALFANAAIADQRPFLDTGIDDWQRVLAVNLDGTFHTTQAVARHLVDRGEGGSIVIVSSMVARYGAATQAAYAASKAGLVSLGKTLAVELAKYRIRSNVLLPGWVETPMNADLRQDERFLQATTNRTPVRRWGQPQDLHEIAAFLASRTPLFHTGTETVIDGGYTIY